MRSLKALNSFSIFLMLIICLCSCRSNKALFTQLGTPTKEYYPNNNIARCIWDMEIVNDKLYIGCGDYNENSGPSPVLYYDLNKQNGWECETWIGDEQIGRFLKIDGKLTIPGFDPVGSPEFGTYYQKEDSWKIISGLPYGMHNYDLIKFNDKLFCGIGATRGKTPIVYTENNLDYYSIPMLKNGKEINTDGGECIRTHNFYVLDNILYGEFWYENISENKLVSEIYKYENEKFIFHSELTGKLNTGLSNQNLPPIYCKKNFNNCIFITTGFLYCTKDLENFTMINFPNYARTYDIYEFDGTLYFLTASQNESDYTIRIYSSTSENVDDFKEEIAFNSSLHPTSFAINRDSCYVSLGNWWNDGDKDNGKVIKVQR